MSSTKKSLARHRRATDLPVAQWLRIGVVSAGMGAALWGASLAGPQVGTAAADSGDSGSATSVSASSSRE